MSDVALTTFVANTNASASEVTANDAELAARISRRGTLPPVRVVATSNLALTGEQTIDSVACVTGERVLLSAQSTASQNGIWVVSSGAWSRGADADAVGDLVTNSTVRINEGTSYAGTIWRLSTTGTITPGTTTQTWVQAGSVPSGAAGGDLTGTYPNPQIAAGAIVNADVNASAAIALSKLAAVTASRALVSDGSGVITPAAVTSTELGYVSGVTSAIQTQINTHAALTNPHSATSAPTADRLVLRDAAGRFQAVAASANADVVIKSQLDAAVTGATIYQGTWNATTNSPSLSSGVGTNGHYYRVATAGSTTLDGISDWGIGDWLVFNGSVWQKIDNTEAFSSILGFTSGAVSINTLTPETTIADTDELAIWDASANAHRKMTRANFVAGLAPNLVLTDGLASVSSTDTITFDDGVFVVDSGGGNALLTISPAYMSTFTDDVISAMGVGLIDGNVEWVPDGTGLGIVGNLASVVLGHAGGRSISGGTVSGESLTLKSTDHATPGKILFGTHSAFDESLGLWGFGTQSPTAGLRLTAAQPAAVGTTPGTAATALLNVSTALGGDTTIATTGVGGAGAATTIASGNGGQATAAATASTGGAGGTLTVAGGAGGAAAVAGTGTNTGGVGAFVSITSGTGGAATGATSGTNTGGAGGPFTIAGGTGGAANTGSGSLVGGTGGAVTVQGGTGGVGTTGGTGGQVLVQGGAAAAMAGAAGGLCTVQGRAGSSTGSGGAGGALALNGGAAGGDNTVSRAGGAITATAGTSKGDSAGGAITLIAGAGGVGTSSTGAVGGAVNIRAGLGGDNTTDGAGGAIVFQTAATLTLATRLTLDAPGNVVVGAAALATSATDGFLYVDSCAGTPSGTPTTHTGRVPVIFDTSNLKWYAYMAGAWKSVTLA